MRMKKCKVCGAEYAPRSLAQVVCSVDCASTYTTLARQKKERKNDTLRKLQLKSRVEWIRDAQQACNAYIRKRDESLPCVSCGCTNPRQWHAGHYRTTKAAPELRFHEDNIHKQCQPCNEHLSGNLIPYRSELIKRIGLAQVEWIEGPHQPAKWTIEELKEIIAYYKQKTKELGYTNA